MPDGTVACSHFDRLRTRCMMKQDVYVPDCNSTINFLIMQMYWDMNGFVYSLTGSKNDLKTRAGLTPSAGF